MRTRIVSLLVCVLALGACSPSRNDTAASACNTEIGKRMNGRSFALDLKDLAAHAKAESADTVLLTSTIVMDKGLPSEDKQSIECRVRFDASGNANVLYLQFNFNNADLRNAQ
ncbi:MAG TPA: hypothetical protein PKD77_02140 [Rudaea sp.]|jgi:uncharacterized lipoprotein NlpE involved in copper resistance|nr:hypothetical protein [Rudaea sp.]